MAKYIDAFKLKRKIADSTFMPDWCMTLVNRVIDDEPTADVEPVIHAKWAQKTEKWGRVYTVCSRCETPVANSYGDHYNHNSYCDVCGAKMDKEEGNG